MAKNGFAAIGGANGHCVNAGIPACFSGVMPN